MRLRLMFVVLVWFTTSFAANPASGIQAWADDSPPAEAVDFDELEAISLMMDLVTRDGAPSARQLFKVLDTRSRADYDAGHIPRSIWVDTKKAQEIAARPGGLTDSDAWVEWLTPLGITEHSVIFVVDGDRQLEAARVWWLLRYLGVDHVGLLDGNFGLWRMQQRPVTQEISDVVPNPFRVEFQTRRLANRGDVLISLKTRDARIIDARSAEEWAGQKLLSKRGGHMPDACRLEWLTFVDKHGRFLPKNQLEARLAAAGVKPGEPVVTHCQGGGRASVDAFVFEMLGYPTRNFYLGWSDWGNADDTPILVAGDESPRPATAPADGDRASGTQEGLVAVSPRVDPAQIEATATPRATAAPEQPAAEKPFVVEYDYKCRWGHADEFLALFQKNHLPILRERMKAGDILQVTMVKPRIHTGEAERWDYRVTIEFKDAAAAFNPAADEPIKQRRFPDQKQYRVEEQRRFEILESHTDLPIEEVDLGKPVTSP